jgi:hypothetical protein
MKRDPENIFLDATSEGLNINTVHVNLAQDCLMITEDRIYRCVQPWKERIEKRESWTTPVALFASLLLGSITASSKDALGVSKETWQAVFIIGMILSGLWAVKAIRACIRLGKGVTIEELISELKKGAAIQKSSVGATVTELKTTQ